MTKTKQRRAKLGLTVKRVARLRRKGKPGRFLDVVGSFSGGAGKEPVRGLYLVVVSRSNSSWQLRYQLRGKPHWYGLGSAANFTLPEARERARLVRQQISDKIDPLQAKWEQAAKAAQAAMQQPSAPITFQKDVGHFLSLHETLWKNAKHRNQWRTTLREYAFPALGKLETGTISTAAVNTALADIWQSIPETAARTKQRIERVIQWVKDGRPLPKVPVSQRSKGHPALPYAQIPAFMAELRQRQGTDARALELLILTAARTDEVIGGPTKAPMSWDEIDWQQKVWNIPSQRMKKDRPHRVPLNDRALAILDGMRRQRQHGNDYVFAGTRVGQGLGDGALLDLLQSMRPDFTVHGLRSSFKDWCAECTNYPNIVSEAALAHAISDKTEAAYRRGDLLVKRKALMRDWGKYCSSRPLPAQGAEIVTLHVRSS
jgi:integrase